MSLEEACAAIATPDAEETGAMQVAGHAARLLRSGQGAAVVWRCDKSARLLRVTAQGPAAPDPSRLAAQVRCHAVAATGNGEVPTAAGSVLGAGWRFGNRGKGSISWMRDDAVLTYFAGQLLQGPRDPDAARKAAPAWAAAAGLSGATVADASPSQGPQGHPAVLVHGAATLDGRAVRWSLLFWRCLRRQKSFVAIVFSRDANGGAGSARDGRRPEAGAGNDGALLSARCHG